MAATAFDVDTPHGPARAWVELPPDPRGALLLGHGAGGSIDAPDLRSAAAVALSCEVAVALVEQPYRVAGKRSAPPAAKLDEAWLAVVAGLRAGPLEGLPLAFGGRSSGARVACRTAAAASAHGVLCLAFPLQPPPRKSGTASPDRQDELDGAGVPVLVVQGGNDRFGVPAGDEALRREVVVIAGDHGLKKDHGTLRDAVAGWLPRVLAPPR